MKTLLPIPFSRHAYRPCQDLSHTTQKLCSIFFSWRSLLPFPGNVLFHPPFLVDTHTALAFYRPTSERDAHFRSPLLFSICAVDYCVAHRRPTPRSIVHALRILSPHELVFTFLYRVHSFYRSFAHPPCVLVFSTEDSHTTGGASARPARWGEERRRNDIRLK